MLNVSALLAAQNYDHPISRIELLETHISWVILTGPYAYKIKKPVDFGFLDFSTLAKRQHFCEEELRLNRRLAADIYLDVIPIYGSDAEPHFYPDGEIVDYAVKMRQFPQSAQLDRLLQQGALRGDYLDAIAKVVAQFHLTIESGEATKSFGEPAQIWQPVAENFAQIRERENRASVLHQLDELHSWSQSRFEQLKPVFIQRRRNGFVRECHGDLHLRNIAWVEDRPIIFDCIEFNPNLRWIDVMSDFAFLFMDLIDRKQSTLAYRLLDRYLTHTGDFAGLSVLPFYFVYRAMVRAKVDSIRLSQTDISVAEREAGQAEFTGYLQLARTFVHRPQPILMITRGLSASGKTTITDSLLQTMGAIRLRSDVERKRLAGMDFMTPAKSGISAGIYTPEMSDRTYNYLLRQAESILKAGFPVIVDAAFLEASRRAPFAQLAQKLQTPFVIAESLRQRIRQRRGDASDADLSILEHQLLQYQPLSAVERPNTITINTEQELELKHLVNQIKEHAEDNAYA